MRRLFIVAALVVFSAPALAQQRAPAPAPSRPAAPPAQAQQPPTPAGMFPCRTQTEVCHVLVVGSANQGTLLYSNAPSAEGKEGGTVTVQGLDLASNVGKVVMLNGEFGANGITNAQLIEAAGPLLSFAIKLQMSGGNGGEDEEEEETAPQKQPQRGGNAPAQRSAPQQQQRR